MPEMVNLFISVSVSYIKQYHTLSQISCMK